jgi:hypothetical protein
MTLLATMIGVTEHRLLPDQDDTGVKHPAQEVLAEGNQTGNPQHLGLTTAEIPGAEGNDQVVGGGVSFLRLLS